MVMVQQVATVGQVCDSTTLVGQRGVGTTHFWALPLTKAKRPGRWGHDLLVETRCVHSGNMESNEQRQGAYLHSCC